MARLYRRSSLLVCNREEAAAICSSKPDDIDALSSSLLALGPRQAVVTDSVAGAYGTDGTKRFDVPVYPCSEPILDRTGAGDAFAATLLPFLARGMTFEDALLRAPPNAMSVVDATAPRVRPCL